MRPIEYIAPCPGCGTFRVEVPITPTEDCLKTVGLDGSLLAMDPDGMCLMEIDDFQSVAGLPWASLWPAENRAMIAASVETARSGKVARFIADCPTPRGTLKSWEVSVAPIRDAEGVVVALQSLSRDVTQRETSQREDRMVSRELAHRIQNLFAVVDGLIHLSGRRHDGAAPFVATLRERLGGLGRAISFIHPLNVGDVAAAPRTVRGLIEALLAPYTEAGASVSVRGHDVPIGQNALTSVAMVLNELATNAVKYGAMRDARGHLDITLALENDRLVLEWRESGVAGLTGSPGPGFGTNLLDRTIQSQLSGSIQRHWTPDGLLVHITLPVAGLE